MPEKITNNADETTIQSLLETQCLFVVPYFQRPYKWQPRKIRSFFEDLQKLAAEGLEDTHFVGAVIIQGQPAPPTVARTYQVIDGQQRLTTIYLILLAFIRSHIELDEFERARSLFNSFLVTSLDTRGRSNLKIQPSGADRSDMNEVLAEILEFKDFKSFIRPTEVRLLEIGGSTRSNRITKNFGEIKKIIREELSDLDTKEQKLIRLEVLYTALLQAITLVQIDIKDPLMGPVIYDRLNSGQEPMTVGELVKNDVLSRGSNLNDLQRDQLDREVWRPFVDAFGNPELKRFDTFLFPYGLIRLDSNAKKGDVYRLLRDDWTARQLGTQEIVDEMLSLQAEFLDLIDGMNRCGFPEELHAQVENLVNLGLPTMMFSFVMRVLHEARLQRINHSEAAECLRFAESFLVRRGAFGLEPSGLHAAFKGMWTDIQRMQDRARNEGKPVPSLGRGLADTIAVRRTVKWPTVEEFKHSLETRALYGSKITRYLLTEFNRSMPGDEAVLEGAEVEHILPQTMSPPWAANFSTTEHQRYLHCIGNLTLLTERMNADVSNQGYSAKRQVYQGSRYEMTRKIAREHVDWTTLSIESRTADIVQWAVGRWKEQ